MSRRAKAHPSENGNTRANLQRSGAEVAKRLRGTGVASPSDIMATVAAFELSAGAVTTERSHAALCDRRAAAGSSSLLWAVVLAGGWGVRLRPLTRLLSGDNRPKQYATLTGSRSLLQQTLDRTGLRIPSERTVVISLEAHASYLAAALARHGARVLHQPSDRGTAAGVLLPAHWIRGRAPDATVAVFPSDHFVQEGEAFMDQVADAASFVDEHPGRIVLLGIHATDPETEYGWIEPGPVLGQAGRNTVRTVQRFIEKPSPEVARTCLAAGASWNTFVFVAKAKTLVQAGRQCVPRIHSLLDRIVHGTGRMARPEDIRRASAALPRANFSRDVLEHVLPMLAVTTLTEVTWCDWGSPRRVVASLKLLGIRPAWLDQLTEPVETGSGG
jgi:mannose-1-phosphate guanylyltransferase